MRYVERIKKKTICGITLFLCLFFLLPACEQSFSDTGKKSGEKSSTEENNKKDEKKAAPLPVKISTIVEGPISSYLEVSSDLEAESHIEVFCRETGLVEKICAMEGARVEKGTILARLEDDELYLEVENARINIENQQQTKERSKVTLEDSHEAVNKANLLLEKSQKAFERCQKYEDVTSKEEFEDKKYEYDQRVLDFKTAQFQAKKADLDYKMSESNVAKARNDLRLKQIRLNNTEIKTPITGKITDRFIREGQYLTAHTKAFAIVNTDLLLTYVEIPQKELRVLKGGLEAQIVTDAMPGETFKGKVRLVSPVIDPMSGTVKVTIDILEGHDRLKPGMFIKAKITLEKREKALLIPKQAILYEPTGPVFYTLQEGKAKKVSFLPGLTETHRMEVQQVLGEVQVKPGDPIIVVGQNKVKDDDAVTVVEEGASKEEELTKEEEPSEKEEPLKEEEASKEEEAQDQ